jgi:hypothetical protein
MSLFKIEIAPRDVIKRATNIEILLQYIFLAEDATVIVYIKDEQNNTLDIKTVYIPKEIYSQWVDTDNFIIDYILKELNLSRV